MEHFTFCSALTVWSRVWKLLQLVSRSKTNRILNWMAENTSHFNSLLISAWIQFWLVAIIYKYFNFVQFSKNLLAILIVWFCPAFGPQNMNTWVSFYSLLDQPTGTSWNMVCCSCYFCSWDFYIFCSILKIGKVTNTTYNVYIPKEFLHSLSLVETSIIPLVESNIWQVIKIYSVLKFTVWCHAIFLFWHSWGDIVNGKLSAWAFEGGLTSASPTLQCGS